MKNYSDYTTEDFLDDERFRKWVDSGEREESVFWEDFKTQFPEKVHDLLLAKSARNSLRSLQIPGDAYIKAKIWENVQDSISEKEFEDHPIGRVRPLRFWWMAAAAVLVIVGLSWVLYPVFRGMPVVYEKQVSHADVPLRETINTAKTDQIVVLKDGSTVKLNPGSKLSYADFSEKQRVVYLDGEGFFDVVKDPSKPFIVYAGQIKVQVVGTSFHVRSVTGVSKSNVSVVSGKVKVSAVHPSGGVAGGNADQFILLTPNQKVVFDAATSLFKKGLVEKPVLLEGTAEAFSFTNTSVKQIFSTLEAAYGVRIRYENTAFESCKVTAPLGNLALFAKLDILCQTLGATYEVFGTEILISGGSCDL